MSTGEDSEDYEHRNIPENRPPVRLPADPLTAYFLSENANC